MLQYREFKKTSDHKAILQVKLNDALQNYESIIDNIKQIQEDIDNMLINQNNQIEERKSIM